MITTPFLLGKETGLCLKEKSNPSSLLPQTLSPYQRGQNAPPEERRFLIPTVAARGRQRFPFQINRSAILFLHFTVGNGLDRSAKPSPRGKVSKPKVLTDEGKTSNPEGRKEKRIATHTFAMLAMTDQCHSERSEESVSFKKPSRRVGSLV